MRNLTFIFCLASLLALATAQQPGRKNQGTPRVKPRLVPSFAISKTVGFEVLKADKTDFIEMESLVCDLPAGTVPGLKKSITVSQLSYGFKKGGVGSVYQAMKLPGVTADALFNAALSGRILKDRQYFPKWSLKAVPDGKFLIAVSGTTPEVREALTKAIGK